MSTTYLPKGLAAPSAAPDGLSQPFWDGTRQRKLMIQKCRGCGATFQFCLCDGGFHI